MINGHMPLSCIENPTLATPTLNKIEMFKSTGFSLIDLMKQDNRSDRGLGVMS